MLIEVARSLPEIKINICFQAGCDLLERKPLIRIYGNTYNTQVQPELSEHNHISLTHLVNDNQ